MKIFSISVATVLGLCFAVAAPAYADDNEEMLKFAKSKNCTTCHAIDKKIIGPAYQDVAKKFASNENAQKELRERVLAGSKGVWGTVPMPPNKVTEEEADKLVKWILSLK